MAVQAKAERQGAAAWRAMIEAEDDPEIKSKLEEMATIEEASADYLDALLPGLTEGQAMTG